MLGDAFRQQPEYGLFLRAFAEKKAPLVIVCGAGLSAPAGLPTWPSLRALLQEEADKRADTFNQIGVAYLKPKIEASRKQSDPWVAFKLLKEILTPPVFERLIEQYLNTADDAAIPAAYKEILKLSPRGLVTLNLDRFASDALAKNHPGQQITPVFGRELAEKWRLLSAAKVYLVYLHGGLHDPASWVLTYDDMEQLQASVGHQHFLRSLFMENIVLLIGVSADDIALSQRLLELTHGGFRPQNLYWLTTRLDTKSDDWASLNHVLTIRYAARNSKDHFDAISMLVTDCLSFVSRDVPEPPLTGNGPSDRIAPVVWNGDPDSLAQDPPEKIRHVLSSLLDERISSAPKDAVYKVYREFCDEFDYAVHRSFYKSKLDKFRDWFGYKLDFPALGKGNFGEVFSAQSPGGELVAVKIMHEGIFNNDDMLGGFRRGVRSMEIVSEHGVSGMVTIKERFELPPTIVMPFVDGVCLEDALRRRPDISWQTRLKIAHKIGEIVSTGHALTQTILHRDLKPSNVMISNFEYNGPFVEPEVVVLDFDMSWHKGSKERDIVFESRDDFGYLSPEQTDPGNRYTARSTRVDSYGFGMCLFFIFGLEAPRPNEALSEHWYVRALRAAQRDYNASWKSAPQRLARLITRSTQIDQTQRADFATIVRDLNFLRVAVDNPGNLDNPELWAEEVLSQLNPDYAWDDATGRGLIQTQHGISIESSCNFRNSTVALQMRYTDRGTRDRGSLSKYLASASTNSDQALCSGGWRILDKRVGGGEALVRAQCDLEALKNGLAGLSLAAGAALKAFDFQ